MNVTSKKDLVNEIFDLLLSDDDIFPDDRIRPINPANKLSPFTKTVLAIGLIALAILVISVTHHIGSVSLANHFMTPLAAGTLGSLIPISLLWKTRIEGVLKKDPPANKLDPSDPKNWPAVDDDNMTDPGEWDPEDT